MHRIIAIYAATIEFLGRLRDRVLSGAGVPPLPMLDEVLEEASRLRPSWGPGLRQLRASGVPMNAEDDDDDDDDDKPLTKKEADKLNKAIAKKDRELRDANKKLGKQDERLTDLEEKLEEAGKKGDGGDEGASDSAAIAKLEARLEKAEAKTEEETEKREAAERQSTAIDVATRLNFRNPKRAVKQLDSDDLDDEDSIESALERLANEEPYMVSSKKQRTVEDDKPKSKKKAEKKKADDDEDDSKKTGDDEPKGKDRIKAAYDEAEGEDEGADEGESD